MFFLYRQNNSGGSFNRDADVDCYVFVEAADSRAADELAEEKGVYFGGVYNDLDCACCGDRWYPCHTEWSGTDGTEWPEIYGEAIKEWHEKQDKSTDNVVIHFADGTRRYASHGGWRSVSTSRSGAKAKSSRRSST